MVVEYIAGTLLIGICIGVAGVVLYFKWKLKKEIRKAKEVLDLVTKPQEVKNVRTTTKDWNGKTGRTDEASSELSTSRIGGEDSEQREGVQDRSIKGTSEDKPGYSGSQE